MTYKSCSKQKKSALFFSIGIVIMFSSACSVPAIPPPPPKYPAHSTLCMQKINLYINVTRSVCSHHDILCKLRTRTSRNIPRATQCPDIPVKIELVSSRLWCYVEERVLRMWPWLCMSSTLPRAGNRGTHAHSVQPRPACWYIPGRFHEHPVDITWTRISFFHTGPRPLTILWLYRGRSQSCSQ